MSGHTKSNNTFVYQLVLFASLLFPTEKVRDVAEDYAEYLRERPEKQESPWQFCSAIMRAEPGYHPKAKTLLAILAAAILFLIGIQTDPVALSFLTVGLPVAFWVAINGSTTARYSSPLPHAVRCVLLPFLAVALLSAGFFLVSHAAVSEPFLITPGMARIIIKGQWVCSAAFLLLFFVYACLLWQSSIWYFCSMVQSLSGWCFLRGIYDFMTSIDVSIPSFSPDQIFYFLIPLALGLTLSLAFALLLRNITGRENV